MQVVNYILVVPTSIAPTTFRFFIYPPYSSILSSLFILSRLLHGKRPPYWTLCKHHAAINAILIFFIKAGFLQPFGLAMVMNEWSSVAAKASPGVVIRSAARILALRLRGLRLTSVVEGVMTFLFINLRRGVWWHVQTGICGGHTQPLDSLCINCFTILSSSEW